MLQLRTKLLWRSCSPLRGRSSAGVACYHAEAADDNDDDEPFTYEKQPEVSDEWMQDKTIAQYIEKEERDERPPELISFLQRAKNILSSHWRCQLSTVNAAAKRDPFHVSLVQFGLLKKPYVLLNTQDQTHKTNLLKDGNVTLIVGHCDPPPLMETIKLLDKVPPHVVVSGILAFASDNEVAMLKEGLSIINAEAKDVVEIGGQALRPIFEPAKNLLNAQFEARKTILGPDSDLALYLLRPTACQYVDLAGEKFEVDILQRPSVSLDSFAALHAGIIEGVNQNDSMRFALKVICMVQRHVNVEEALLYSVDRAGFDVFAKVVKGKSSKWKGLRFNFTRMATDAIGLCRQLVAMERECWQIMKDSPALEAIVSNAALRAAAEVPADEDAFSKDAEKTERSDNEEESETARLVDLL